MATDSLYVLKRGIIYNSFLPYYLTRILMIHLLFTIMYSSMVNMHISVNIESFFLKAPVKEHDIARSLSG